MEEYKYTDKQKRFIEEYLIDFNATQAAKRAGYSEKTAYSIGQELLTKPEIKAAIELKQSETSNSLQVTKESLIKDLIELKELAKNDPKSFHNSIKAIEVINKMLGFNEPDKVENNISLNDFSVKDLVDFDDED